MTDRRKYYKNKKWKQGGTLIKSALTGGRGRSMWELSTTGDYIAADDQRLIYSFGSGTLCRQVVEKHNKELKLKNLLLSNN